MTPKLTLIAVFERAEDARAARAALAGSGLGAQTLEPEGEASDFKSDGSIRDTVQDMFLSLTGEEGAQSEMEALYRAAIERGNRLLAVTLEDETAKGRVEELLRRHGASDVLARSGLALDSRAQRPSARTRPPHSP